MKRIEQLLTAGVLALVVLASFAAQLGWINPAALGGALFGQAAGIAVPVLDEAAMIRRGAGHYERVCASCHASPDRPDRGDELALTPPPPKLHLRVEDWPPEVLFATIKHGIDNTAMPAWPAGSRDDEVWDMVAFLGVLPSLDAPSYREIAGLDRARPEDSPAAAERCITCHGADGGGSAEGAFPRLDIQSETYLLASLHAFRDGERASGFMQSAVNGLHDEELAALAAFFAGAPDPAVAGDLPPIIQSGIPATRASAGRLPACGACHGPPMPARPDFPNLAGQHESYLLEQLGLFAAGHRGGGPFAPLMHEVARDLTDEDMAQAAAWYAAAGGE